MIMTDAQREAAHAPGSVAITAGAGTGKTQLLSERYAHHLVAHGLSPLQIVVATFTEKAAAELRGRIRQRLAQHLPDQPDRLAELEAAPIGTIHALAARICREHPEAAGTPADFQVLDEQEGALWRAEQLEAALAGFDAPLSEGLTFSRLEAAMQALLKDPLTAAEALSRDPAGVPALLAAAQVELVQDFQASPVVQAAARAIATGAGAPADLIEARRLEAVGALAALARPEAAAEAIMVLAKLSLRGGAAKHWANPDDLARVKAALTALKAEAKALTDTQLLGLELGPVDDLLAECLPALRAAFAHCLAYLDAAKAAARVLDFADLEVRALRALEDPAVVAYYRERWRAFMIDEFQDTNPVQATILRKLAGDALLTIVGDEKQSIYGFRRADVEVFRRYREEIGTGGGRVVGLVRSFRTHGPLVGTLNRLFAPILGPLHQPLEAAREAAPAPAPHVRLVTVEKGGNKADRLWLEARHLAATVRQALDDGLLVQGPDGPRPAAPGDFAVLGRTWAPLDVYSDALAAVGVPASVAGGGDLMATREAQDAWALLRFLADPADDLALAAVLRAPWFAVADPDLDAFARPLAKPRMPWWPAMQVETPAALARARTVLAELLTARRFEPPSRLLQLADRLTGYSAVIARLPGAARRQADWRGMLALVRGLEATNQDVFQLVRRVTKLLAAEVAFERPYLEAHGAVTLMTVHKAKGLEWPVVYLPDLARSGYSETAPVRFDAALGLALRSGEPGDESPTQSVLWQLLGWQQGRREAAERARVFYVACTRARDHLFMSATEGTGSAMGAIQPGFDAAGIVADEIPYDPALARPPLPLRPPAPAVPDAFLLGPAGGGLRELPASSLAEYDRCPRSFRFRFVEGHPGLSEGSGHAARVGTLVHAALEHDLADLPALQAHDPGLPPEAVADALALAGRFRSHEAYAALRALGGERERRFRLPVALPGGGRVVLNGAIDMVGPGFVLDYKTDREVAPAHHRHQLWAYATATGHVVAHLAYLRHDHLHTFDAAALAAAGAAVRGLLVRIAAGAFGATPSAAACGYCPFGEACDERAG